MDHHHLDFFCCCCCLSTNLSQNELEIALFEKKKTKEFNFYIFNRRMLLQLCNVNGIAIGTRFHSQANEREHFNIKLV